MKKIMIVLTVMMAATSLLAAPKKAKRAPAAASEENGADLPMVKIDQYPSLGRKATLASPSIPGETSLTSACYTGKQRRWIVLESKYTTNAPCLEQLTFTFHVLLETKSATAKDREGQAKMAPYSYLTQNVTYRNIPKGSHAASVCLHPSYLEQYGEPKAVGLVVTDMNGKEIVGDTISEIKGVKAGTKFWEDNAIMNAEQNGEPMIERRQGLLDRSKTIWALVKPDDYELSIQ